MLTGPTQHTQLQPKIAAMTDMEIDNDPNGDTPTKPNHSEPPKTPVNTEVTTTSIVETPDPIGLFESHADPTGRTKPAPEPEPEPEPKPTTPPPPPKKTKRQREPSASPKPQGLQSSIFAPFTPFAPPAPLATQPQKSTSSASKAAVAKGYLETALSLVLKAAQSMPETAYIATLLAAAIEGKPADTPATTQIL